MGKLQKIILSSALLVCTILQVLPIVRSGLDYNFGKGFWGPLGHDFIWHLSLVQNMSNPLKIDLGVFSGAILQNYHPFYDIFVFVLHKLSGIPASIIIFQIFPVISSLIFLYLSFLIGQKITKSFSGGMLLLILNTINTSFGWVVNFFRNFTFEGESLFWAMQSPSNQINPPFLLSLIFLEILILILLNDKISRKNVLLIIVILVLLPITKVYSALIGFGLVGLYSLKSLLKKDYKLSRVTVFSLIAAFLIFRIYNPNSSGLLVFKPFWFINSLIESPDRLYIPFLANMRYALEASGNIGPRLLAVWTISSILFIVGNFGWRIIGLIDYLKKPDFFKSVLLVLTIITILFPMFFIQKSTSWNTIQFLYYGLFIGNIFLASYLNSIIDKNTGKVLIVVIMLSNLLSLAGTLKQYLGFPPPSSLPTSEVNALNFLKSEPQGTILSYPYDAYVKKAYSSTPIPLYAYETTSYISAYSSHPVFFEDEMNLGNSEYDFESRKNASQKFFQQLDQFQDRGFLVNNNISYIYLTASHKDILNNAPKDLSISNIYNDGTTIIYKVLR